MTDVEEREPVVEEEENGAEPDIAEEADEDDEEDDEEEEEEEEEQNSVENSDVATKYRDAARVVNTALEGCVSQCVAGASVLDVCKFGDAVIAQSTERLYRKKINGRTVEKGIAFPTCVSVNEVVCHHSPLESDKDDLRPLEDGDIVKIDLGCHIDGYIALAAHTIVVGANFAEAPLEGRRADAFAAAFTAGTICEKLIKNGGTNAEVTAALAKVAETFDVNLIKGTTMHQMKRFVIDAAKVISLVDDPEQPVDPCTFETGEVYCIDVAVSTGEGKCREAEVPTTVFKRIVENTYNLRQRFARQLLRDINTKSPTLPFTLRSMGTESQARAGLRECLANELLLPYPVMVEREGETIVHVKFTVLLLPTGTTRITGMEYPVESFKSDKQVDEETAAILAQQGKKKRRNKKKKKASEAAPAES
uniref:Peptidase M24 domain-containing protein n=2 Tax=Pinguiococcus pyrenoidosus TaxID=172671 RepID=A0A7R9Y9E1_9STRA|mmetsp:Transcript_1417/g.6190  ORF Transcript_1417/g.6190 Transcript_1417/m.6190 type:complete len:421 (+) Transcript_1417:256-1518(+)